MACPELLVSSRYFWGILHFNSTPFPLPVSFASFLANASRNWHHGLLSEAKKWCFTVSVWYLLFACPSRSVLCPGRGGFCEMLGEGVPLGHWNSSAGHTHSAHTNGVRAMGFEMFCVRESWSVNALFVYLMSGHRRPSLRWEERAGSGVLCVT